MFGYLWRFLADADEFQRVMAGVNLRGAFERAKSPIKMGLIALGGMLMTGQIDLGPKAWWVSPFLMAVSALIQKSGTADLSSLLANMSDADRAKFGLPLKPTPPTP